MVFCDLADVISQTFSFQNIMNIFHCSRPVRQKILLLSNVQQTNLHDLPGICLNYSQTTRSVPILSSELVI